LYFNDLTLALGEIMTINLDPAIISLFSNVRPDLSGYLVSGSDLDWPLISGINYTALFMYGGTGATTDAYMIWQDGLMGLDGASW